jgi:hypothetical protein
MKSMKSTNAQVIAGTGKDSIGDLPGDMNAWDKLQLGWLDYDVANAGKRSSHKLGVAEYNTKNPQALIVQLPDKTVTTEVVAPAQGKTQWWSGSGNDLRNSLSRSVDLTGKSAASLTLDGWWDIEQDYDYLYTGVSTDGSNWTPIDGTTLLHLSIDFAEQEVFDWLLAHGADVNARATAAADGFGGHTPLFHTVVSGPWSRLTMLQSLLARGASTDTRASLHKFLDWRESPFWHEARNVTAVEWGRGFPDPTWVSAEALRLLGAGA